MSLDSKEQEAHNSKMDEGADNTSQKSAVTTKEVVDYPKSPSQVSRAGSRSSRRSSRSGGSRRRGAGNHGNSWPDPDKYNARSFCLFTLQSPLRKFLIACIEIKWWDRTVLFVILLNTITLAMYDPYDVEELRPISPLREALEYISKAFSAFFAAECLVKLIALGFFYGRRTYLSDSWNYLDFFIVIIGLLDFFPSGGGTGNLSAMRSLRVLRPLRAITKFPQLKFLVMLLFQCIPMLANVIGLLAFIFFVFGILGIQLFGGLLRGSCYHVDTGNNDGSWDGGPCSIDGSGHNLCDSMHKCLLLASNPNLGVTNFDSIVYAFANIFQVMTQAGWTDVMYSVQDAYSYQMWIYFIVLIFIGPIFAVQLFLVVISTKYASVKEESKKVDAEQLAKAVVTESKPAAPTNKVFPDPEEPDKLGRSPSDLASGVANEVSNGRQVAVGARRKSSVVVARRASTAESVLGIDVGSVFTRRRRTRLGKIRAKIGLLATSSWLENFISVMIVLNTLIMAMNYSCDMCVDHICPRYKGALESTNVFFAAVFVFEFLVKVIGLGPYRYFAVAMNWLDVAIVIVGLIEVPTTVETSSCYLRPQPCEQLEDCESGGGGISALRTFRLVRIVKLLRSFPNVQKQVRAIVSTLSSVAALIALISIFLLIFCILGMNLLGGKVLQGWDPTILELGSSVFVRIPGDTLEQTPFPVQGRRGRIMSSDFANHTYRPWKVCVFFGTEVRDQVPVLDSDGCLWAAGKDTAGIGTPAIVGVMDRGNYDDLWHAAITTFGILTGSNWNSHMYLTTKSMGMGIFFYYVLLIVVGNWMLLNLFIAILIQGFAEEKQKKLEGQKAMFAQRILEKLGDDEEVLSQKLFALFEEADSNQSGMIDLNEMEQLLKKCEVEMAPKDLFRLFNKYDEDQSGEISFTEFMLMIKELIDDAHQTLEFADPELLQGSSHGVAGNSGKDGGKDNGGEDAKGNKRDDAQVNGDKRKVSGGGSGAPESPSRFGRGMTRKDMDKVLRDAEALAKEAEKAREEMPPSPERPAQGTLQDTKVTRSLGCLSVNNPFRRVCKAILDYPPTRTENKYMDNVILVCIVGSSASLAMEHPDMGEDSPEALGLNKFNLFLNAIFIFECGMKIIVLSFRTYIRNGWNKLDFFIVSTSLIDITLTYALAGQAVNLAALKIFRILRILRALRPLRIIARAKGLRVLTSTLLGSAKPIMNTVGIALGVFGVFGILGMQLLLGKMFSCTDRSIFRKEECVGVDGNGDARLWQTYPVNFNHIFESIMAMFILATQDNWQVHMWAGVDATSTKTGPFQNNSPVIALFYMSCIMVAGYLVVNIFVGVFVDSYNIASDKMSQESAGKKEPLPKMMEIEDPPEHDHRVAVSDVVTTTSFDLFIAFFIVTNVLTMAFESFHQSSWQRTFGEVANMFFSLVFGWECAFKMFAFFPRRYYRAGWNRFDFFIVMVTFGGIAIDSLGNAVNLDPTILRILRIFRIFRILRAFRIFKAAKGLQAILATLAKSLPALFNLFGMLALFFFIFAVLGVTLFGGLCNDRDAQQPGLEAMRCMLLAPDELLDSKVTLRNIGLALLTLFRVGSGDGWGAIMNACSLSAPPRPKVTDDLWDEFHKLNGSEPDEAARNALGYMDFVRFSIRGWNASVSKPDGTYMDDGVDWPYPASAPAATSWMQLARQVMQVCMSDEEALELQKDGYLDCSIRGYKRTCSGTCGDQLTANLYFFFFCVVASFILLQLVIAVLMEQLSNTSDKAEAQKKTPGCFNLKFVVFARMQRRWRFNALHKLQQVTKRRRLEEAAAAGQLQQPLLQPVVPGSASGSAGRGSKAAGAPAANGRSASPAPTANGSGAAAPS